MYGSNLATDPGGWVGERISAQMLRQWCSPKVILAVTNLTDEQVLLSHVLRQARPGSARVLLAYFVPHQAPSGTPLWKTRLGAPQFKIREAQMIAERMARQLRWLGIQSEPIISKASPSEEVSALVRSGNADRVLFTVQAHRALAAPASCLDSEGLLRNLELLHNLEVPCCIIGPRVIQNYKNTRFTRRVTLALSPGSDCEVALRFASRYAQENDAVLTLIQVLSDSSTEASAQNHASIALPSALPQWALREAELLCSMETAVRIGDPAEEILKFDSSTRQDLIILNSPGSEPQNSAGVGYSVICEASCPVMILGRQHSAGEEIGRKPPIRLDRPIQHRGDLRQKK